MLTDTTWVLVSNGVRARILCGLGGGAPNGPGELVGRARCAHLRAVLADRTGRALAESVSGRRGSPLADPILRDMQDFARDTLYLLALRHGAGDFARLVILASPKMLGVLRRQLPAELRGALILTRSVDLIGMPDAELRTVVRRMLGPASSVGS